jgi:hypothetical protein
MGSEAISTAIQLRFGNPGQFQAQAHSAREKHLQCIPVDASFKQGALPALALRASFRFIRAAKVLQHFVDDHSFNVNARLFQSV